MEQFMPVLPLQGARIVVVGDGDSAENKVRLFRNAPCRLDWYCLDRAGPTPRDLSEQTHVISGRLPVRGAFDQARLVFIATQDQRLAQQWAKRARRARAWVNVVDQPELSDFFTPALVDRGAVTIALSTGGAAPILVRDLRSALEAVIPRGVGLLASAARELRDTVRAVTSNVDERRAFWERALRGRAVLEAESGDEPGVRRALLAELESFRNAEPASGVVHLVGAGPGDPDLLTVKALKILRDADVLVFDRLVSDEVIDRARRDALRIDVGKTRGRHPVPQKNIANILIEHARAGRRVVRLKGGDSFIFGRGGEELEALRAADIEAHVVPGISAALACAASAQTPLTHRDLAQAVTFVTGQPKCDGPDPDYRALAAANHTVVIYMGVGTAAQTAKAMIAAGRAPDTPVAVVENGSLPEERLISARLDELGEAIDAHNVVGPAILIVGEVARMARVDSVAITELVTQAQKVAA